MTSMDLPLGQEMDVMAIPVCISAAPMVSVKSVSKTDYCLKCPTIVCIFEKMVVIGWDALYAYSCMLYFNTVVVLEPQDI